jgi:hypothetical protein
VSEIALIVPPSGGRPSSRTSIRSRMSAPPWFSFFCWCAASATRPMAFSQILTTPVSQKSHLFAGSDGGGNRWAVLCSLIEICKRNGVEPHAHLRDALTRMIAGSPIKRSRRIAAVEVTCSTGGLPCHVLTSSEYTRYQQIQIGCSMQRAPFKTASDLQGQYGNFAYNVDLVLLEDRRPPIDPRAASAHI